MDKQAYLDNLKRCVAEVATWPEWKTSTMPIVPLPTPTTYLEADEKVKSLLTQEFLETLTEIAKIYGWSGDYSEIYSFIEWLYKFTNLPLPDLNPYDLTE